MAKVIRQSHITGEAGVIKFSQYCNSHKPYIVFREVTKNDFGIDGEVELTKINEDKKIEPTGEILKVQIKTTASEESYIRNETNNQFEFIPTKDDLEYWLKYKRHGIEVLLVIYDLRNDRLYCKKIFDYDIKIAQENIKKKRVSNALLFMKSENTLEKAKNDFKERFSSAFKGRINYDKKEFLITNLLKFKHIPKTLYEYSARYKSKKVIFEKINQNEVPYFIIKDSKVYTFSELSDDFKIFKTSILESDKYNLITFNQIMSARKIRNYYVELLNEYLRDFLWKKRLAFSKDYKRYYFRLLPNEEEFVVTVTTRKRRFETQKKVVKKYNYGKYTFYRHLAIEFNYEFQDESIFLILTPKYLFTEDGKKTLEPKLITRFTNYLTAREYNNHFCDWLHFWWCYFTKDGNEWVLFEYAAQDNKATRITLNPYFEIEVGFGIALDRAKDKEMEQTEPGHQESLFE